MLSLLQVPPKI